jgi:hypothetical protein
MPFFRDDRSVIIFAHQLPQLGGVYSGNWRVRDFLPFGPFCWKAGEGDSTLFVPISGPVDFIVSGGKEGGRIRIEDEQSGYEADPFLPAEMDGNFMQISVPGSAAYRAVKLTALNPGVCLFAIKTREPQPYLPHVKFDYSTLPPP